MSGAPVLFGLVVGVASALLLTTATLWNTARLRRAPGRLASDPHEDEVGAVIGNVLLDNEAGIYNEANYTLRVGEFLFRLTQEECFAFKQGDMYAIYFSPPGKAVLSAEPLDE